MNKKLIFSFVFGVMLVGIVSAQSFSLASGVYKSPDHPNDSLYVFVSDWYRRGSMTLVNSAMNSETYGNFTLNGMTITWVVTTSGRIQGTEYVFELLRPISPRRFQASNGSVWTFSRDLRKPDDYRYFRE
jgi:hypothetical protein